MDALRPLLLPVTETARLLATSRSKIYEMIAAGQLESVKLGRRRLIPREAVEEYVASLRGCAGSPEPPAAQMIAIRGGDPPSTTGRGTRPVRSQRPR